MTDTLRPDLKAIAELVPHQSRVLDIGCGEGELLAWLAKHKLAEARGLEIDPQKVARAIASGVSVIQGDIETDLTFFPDAAFDVVILSQTLQAMQKPKTVLAELMRIGRTVIVSVPNFGHWRNRLYLGIKGRMPVTSRLSYEWYETPNIHFCTITDFVVLCEQMRIRVARRIWVNAEGAQARFSGYGRLANLFGEQGVFMLTPYESAESPGNESASTAR
jgi:methionine biosynthesis protein MetW